jgi:hypothetical protein
MRCDSPIFERQILRKIFGPIQIGKDTWRIRNNAELDRVINGTDIVRFIKAQRFKWLGRIQRMDTSRIAKGIFELKPIGRRSLGRPRLRWLDDVCVGRHKGAESGDLEGLRKG